MYIYNIYSIYIIYIIYIYTYIYIYIYQFESHLNMCWINKKKVLKTHLLSKYFTFFTEASSV